MLSDQLTKFDGLLAEVALKGPAWAKENELDTQADYDLVETPDEPQDDPSIESTLAHIGNVWAALSEPLAPYSTKVLTVARQQSQRLKTISVADLFASDPMVQLSPPVTGTLVSSAVPGLVASADLNSLFARVVSALHGPTIRAGNWQAVYVSKEGNYAWLDSDSGGRETSEIEHLVGQLRNLPNLHDNWDGYGGVTPERDAVEYAVAFLNLASKEISGLPMPRPSLAGSGEVGVYWSFGEHGFYGDIGFFADGRMNYYVEEKGGRYASEGGIMFDRNKLPDQLLNLLKVCVSQRK